MTADPDKELLQRFLDGSLEGELAKEVEEKVESEESWREALDEISGLPKLTHEFLGIVRSAPPAKTADEVLDLIHSLKASAPGVSDEDLWKEVLGPPPEPNPHEAVGMLGDYEVVELIARGGMGLVFKARDPSLDRVVAIKALSPLLAENNAARERFLREARAAAKLEHEHILPIHSVHEGDGKGGVPWFAMRYVEGGTLESLVGEEKQPVPFEQLVSVARQMASALHAAHSQGIIHRDLKPSNILVDAAPESAGAPVVPNIYLTDFGIARATEDPSLTYPGLVAGTPQYMAPEQAEGKEIDHRADLFSLGAVLFEAVTGKSPFPGKTTRAVMESVSKVEPQIPAKQRRELPDWFVRMVKILLAKNPAHRFQSAGTVVNAIDKRRAPRPRLIKGRRPLIAAAALVVLAAGLWGLLQWNPVAQKANDLLASPDRPFVNAARLGVYSNLAQAIEESEPGDTIEIRAAGTWKVGKPAVIGRDHPLTLRAAEGSVFKMDATYCPASMIKTGSDLRLEGLTIIRGRNSTAAPIIDVLDGTLVVQNCRILTEGQRTGSNRTRTLAVHGGASLEIRDSYVLTSWTIAILMSQEEGATEPIHVALHNSSFSGLPPFGLMCRPDGIVKMDFNRVVVDGPATFGNVPRGPLPEMVITAKNSVFNTEGSLWWLPFGDISEVEKKVVWKGERNLFPDGIGFIRTSRHPDQVRGVAPVGTFEQWRGLEGVECVDSVQTKLWRTAEVEMHFPSNRFDIEVKHMRAVSEGYLAPYPGVGPDLDKLGPQN